MVILIANPVTVNLVTQLKRYVINLMDHAHVWTDLLEEDVKFAVMNVMQEKTVDSAMKPLALMVLFQFAAVSTLFCNYLDIYISQNQADI